MTAGHGPDWLFCLKRDAAVGRQENAGTCKSCLDRMALVQMGGNGMEYIKLFWEDAPEGEPPLILYEVETGKERLARRSIDIFADGRACNIEDLYADAVEVTPIPM